MAISLKKRRAKVENLLEGGATIHGWVVFLESCLRVRKAPWWADEVLTQGEGDIYYVEAQDEIGAFSEAMKLREALRVRKELVARYATGVK